MSAATTTDPLDAAEAVAAVLEHEGVQCALIGAGALAVHGYPRSTEDLDLATGIEPSRLAAFAPCLRELGWEVEVHEPDAGDPLGGVLRLSRSGAERLEVVNFCNPPSGGFPALAEVALREALPLRGHLRVVTLVHLVLFKLYAGGLKSRQDVLELLSRNPSLDLDELRRVCAGFRLDRRLDAWLAELARSVAD